MQKYIVKMEQVVVTIVTITAESMDEAEELALSGNYTKDDVIINEVAEGYINSVKKVI